MTQETCKIPGCERPVLTRQMCNMHMLRVKRYGDPNFVKKIAKHPSDTCTHPGCKKPYYGKGLCKLHYVRQRYGQHGLVAPKCEQCGKDTPRPDARFCGVPCKMRWYRKHGCYRDEVVLGTRGACSIPNCADPVHSHNMCRTHAKRVWKYGNPHADLSPKPAKCSKCSADCIVQNGKKPICRKCYAMHYYYLNHGREKARRSGRRARTKLATPKWANVEVMAAFYDACPAGCHVDYIVPLRGRRVSGLHTIENLQYLTAEDNFRKRNHF